MEHRGIDNTNMGGASNIPALDMLEAIMKKTAHLMLLSDFSKIISGINDKIVYHILCIYKGYLLLNISLISSLHLIYPFIFLNMCFELNSIDFK